MKNIDFLESSINDIINLLQNSKSKSALDKTDALLKKNKHFYIFNLKGLALVQLGLYQDAIKAFKNCIKYNPEFPDAHNSLGTVLINLGKTEDANLSFKRAITLNSSFTQAYYNLANSLINLGKLFEAIDVLNSILKNNQDDFSANNLMADIYAKLNKPWESISFRKKALANFKDNHETLNVMGNTYLSLGDFKNAKENYKKSYIDRPNIYALRNLINLQDNCSDEDLARAKELRENAKDKMTEADACFALYAINEKNKQFDVAYQYLSEANRLKNSTVKFELKPTINFFNLIKKNYIKLKDKKIDLKESNQIPIFILGLPRSGSTLCEQLISADDNIYGAGELGVLADILLKFIAKDNFSINDVNNLRMEYFSFIKKLTDKQIFIDKTPGNFISVGLLSTIFPEAYFIHTKRDLFSVAFSNYQQNFSGRGMYWTFDQTNIFEMINFYKEASDFWEKENLKKYTNLIYEDLINDPEKISKQLFTFLNLEYKKKYLDLSQNKKPVLTASSLQVRQKLNRKGIENWEKYNDYIQEFKNLIDSI